MRAVIDDATPRASTVGGCKEEGCVQVGRKGFDPRVKIGGEDRSRSRARTAFDNGK